MRIGVTTTNRSVGHEKQLSSKGDVGRVPNVLSESDHVSENNGSCSEVMVNRIGELWGKESWIQENLNRKIEINGNGDPKEISLNDLGIVSEEIVGKATVPSSDIKAQVELIQRSFLNARVPDPTNCQIPEDTFYLGYSAGVFSGTATSSLTPWISFGISQLRNYDAYLTHKGYKNASAQTQVEQRDCLNYLNAQLAICALNTLKGPALSKEDDALISKAVTEAQSLATETYPNFARCAADEFNLRAMLAYTRDVVFSVFSTLNGGNTIAARVFEDLSPTQLSDSAKEFLGVVPWLGWSLSLISGLTSSIQGALEINNASDLKKDVLAAELLEKEVFAKYGSDDKLLLHLIWHRQQRRDLEFLKAKLLKYHGAFRVTNGVTGIGGTVTTIALTAAGGVAVFGAATMGIPVIVGGVVAGLYLLWVNTRSAIAQHAQKSYDKVMRSIIPNNEAKQQHIPGLPKDSSHPSIQEISEAFSKKIADEKTKTTTIDLLVAMGIPKSIAETADRDSGKLLADHLIPPRGIPMTNKDALRKVILGGGTAEQKLLAVQQWLNNPDLKDIDLNSIAKKTCDNSPDKNSPDKNSLPWSKYLAPGESVGDLCKSRLTLRRIQAHWHEDEFKNFMKASLNQLDTDSADVAWSLLQSQREKKKAQEKASATVAAWIHGMKFDSILGCLNCRHELLKNAYREVLRPFDCDKDNMKIDDIKKALQAYVMGTNLDVNTIGTFMAFYKASSGLDKDELGKKMNVFLETTHEKMHKDDKKEFREMLGLTGGEFTPLKDEQMQQMLGKIHKFLLVSDKLNRQKLTKVIASLYDYPGALSIPKDVARLAAIRELRFRYNNKPKVDKIGNNGDNGDKDFGYALALAKQLSKKKLHGWNFGYREGGAGPLGIFGYSLNESGKFVRELMELCLDEEYSPSNSFSSHMANLLRAPKKFAVVDCTDGLTRWTIKLIGEVVNLGNADLLQLADTLDLYRTPGKLEKALKSKGTYNAVDEKALDCLNKRLSFASQQLGKAAAVLKDPIARKGFDSSSFVTQLTEFFSLQKLASNCGLQDSQEVAELPAGLKYGLEFYRAALQWPNKTARAKNITAIKWELDNLKTGTQCANSFWSAKFLKSQSQVTENKNLVFSESAGIKGRYGFKEIASYKSLVKKANALDSMRLSSLYRAVKKGDGDWSNWLNNQFALYGLVWPDLNEQLRKNLLSVPRGPVVSELQKEINLLVAIAKMRKKAFEDKLKNELLADVPR